MVRATRWIFAARLKLRHPLNRAASTWQSSEDAPKHLVDRADAIDVCELADLFEMLGHGRGLFAVDVQAFAHDDWIVVGPVLGLEAQFAAREDRGVGYVE